MEQNKYEEKKTLERPAGLSTGLGWPNRALLSESPITGLRRAATQCDRVITL